VQILDLLDTVWLQTSLAGANTLTKKMFLNPLHARVSTVGRGGAVQPPKAARFTGKSAPQ